MTDVLAERVLANGGTAGELARSVEWSKTALGPIEGWSQALRAAAGLVLHNHSGMLLWWGADFVQIYNDAYRPVLGDKHPRAMGQRFRECWTEVFHIVGPMAERPFLGGQATSSDDLPLLLNRKVPREESHFCLAYSPVPDETVKPTGIGGVLATVIETTDKVYAERQLRTLKELGALSLSARDTVGLVCEGAAATLANNRWDVPFALFYLLDAAGKRARLAANVGFADADSELAPAEIAFGKEGQKDPWQLENVARERAVRVIPDIAPHGRSLPLSPWEDEPTCAIVLPLASPDQTKLEGVLICGVSPHRVLDSGYRTFFELAAAQVVAGLRLARAFEEERKRVEALAAIDRAKTTFFSNISHEFRTPLTLMIGPMEDALASPERQLGGEALELAHRNAIRLTKLVNTLLDFARIEAGRVDASYEPTDLAAFTGELASLFRSAIEHAGLRFAVEMHSVEAEVFVDREMWEKIVLNLLSNALKFTMAGEIGISLGRRGSHVSLVVRDTGAGIPAAELPHLFERFHRVHGVKARTQEGSGIGLSLVSELVKLHGGELKVESAEGKGSSFEVLLPLGSAHLPRDQVAVAASAVRSLRGAEPYVLEARRWLPDAAAGSAAEQAPATPSHLLEGRVLIVDDNADMRDYVARLLSSHWIVESVKNGVEALAAIRERRPDLVVSDVMMPELDGFGLLRAVRADPALRELQVILLSARAGEEATVEGIAAGADDYLVKPFSARDLLVRVAGRMNLAKLRRNLYRHLTQAPFPIVIFRGPEMRIELANDACLRVWGRDATIVGKPFVEALPEVADQPFPRRLDEVYRTGVAYEGHAELARIATGRGDELEDVYFSYVYAPLLDAAGRVEGVLVAAFDVTAQVGAARRIEHARRDAEALTRELAESRARADYAVRLSGIGFWYWYCDLPFDELMWDARVKEHFFLSPEARVTIETFYERIVPEDREPTRRAIETSIHDHSIYDVVYRTRHPEGGATKWIRAMGGTVYAADGTPVRFDGVTVDISIQKREEERIASAATQAEEASRAKDEFLAMLGHELRNPLAPISTAVHLLKLRSSPNIEREIAVIDRQSKHIARLVDDLLDVSRIARGKVALNKDSTEVADIVAAAIETATPAIENGHHELTVNVPRRGLVVDVDRGRMTQVVANLLTNAAKYTPAAGRIRVTAQREERQIVISVEDNGIGIQGELLARVFDLFVQSRQPLDRSQGGLGLGLALVKNLVVMHGGSVTAQSDGLGRGGTFTVRLPALDAAARRDEPLRPAVVAGATRQRRVLAVDDNVDGAEMLADALEVMGYGTTVAHDGPAALGLAADFASHVALLDIGLPVMDGYELAEKLRERWRDVKLVAITGYGQESDRQRARNAGFHAHLTKPVDFAQLSAVPGGLAGETPDPMLR